MITFRKMGRVAVMSLLLSACATDNHQQQAAGLPDWIESEGFISTECVIASSSLSIDRKEALSKAQVTLAQQLDAKIKALDEIQMAKNGGQVSERFSSKSAVMVDTTVRGAKIRRQGYVDLRGKEHFCLQIAISEAEQAALFNTVAEPVEPAATEPQVQNLQVGYAETNASPPIFKASGSRVALIIGNKDYVHNPLRNPLKDARAIRDKLKKLGFDIVYRENATLQQMEKATEEFKRKLSGQSVGLFYYSGHGLQYEGENYLVPVNDSGINEASLKYKAFNLGLVLDNMKSSAQPVSIIILDACRDNPFRGFRSTGSRGLVPVSGPTGSIIAFATAPGQTASDGSGDNGIYTTHLLSHLEEPGITVEQMFKKVRQDVEEDTHKKQIPWENSSLSGEFCFNGCFATPQ